MQGDSCHGVWGKTIPQFAHVSPDVQMKPLPAVGPGSAEPSLHAASLRVVTPPYTMGLLKGGPQRLSLTRLASLSTSTLACWIRSLSPRFGLDLYFFIFFSNGEKNVQGNAMQDMEVVPIPPMLHPVQM